MTLFITTFFFYGLTYTLKNPLENAVKLRGPLQCPLSSVGVVDFFSLVFFSYRLWRALGILLHLYIKALLSSVAADWSGSQYVTHRQTAGYKQVFEASLPLQASQRMTLGLNSATASPVLSGYLC